MPLACHFSMIRPDRQKPAFPLLQDYLLKLVSDIHPVQHEALNDLAYLQKTGL